MGRRKIKTGTKGPPVNTNPNDLTRSPLRGNRRGRHTVGERTSARQIMEARNTRLLQEAVALRLAGYNYQEIADLQHCDKSTAMRRVHKGLEETSSALENDATQLRTIELERLERMHRSLWPKAQAGDEEAIDRCMRISAQRAKLQGLDVNQVELTFDDQAMAVLAQIISRRVDARTAALIQSDMAAYALMQPESDEEDQKMLPSGTIDGVFEELEDANGV